MSKEQSKEDYLVGGLFLAIVMCIISIYALYASKSLSFLWMLIPFGILVIFLSILWKTETNGNRRNG